MRSPSRYCPISFSPEQLKAVMEAAEPLSPRERHHFLLVLSDKLILNRTANGYVSNDKLAIAIENVLASINLEQRE